MTNKERFEKIVDMERFYLSKGSSIHTNPQDKDVKVLLSLLIQICHEQEQKIKELDNRTNHQQVVGGIKS